MLSLNWPCNTTNQSVIILHYLQLSHKVNYLSIYLQQPASLEKEQLIEKEKMIDKH